MSKKQLWLTLSVVAVFFLQGIIESIVEKDPQGWGVWGMNQKLDMLFATWVPSILGVVIFWILVAAWKELK